MNTHENVPNSTYAQQSRLDGSQVRVGKATSTLSPQTNIVCGSTDLLLGRQTIPPISKGIAIYKYVYCILFLNDILKPILKSNYFIHFCIISKVAFAI